MFPSSQGKEWYKATGDICFAITTAVIMLFECISFSGPLWVNIILENQEQWSSFSMHDWPLQQVEAVDTGPGLFICQWQSCCNTWNHWKHTAWCILYYAQIQTEHQNNVLELAARTELQAYTMHIDTVDDEVCNNNNVHLSCAHKHPECSQHTY